MRGINGESVDLIYLDPPFNSNANYAAPIGSEAAGAEFKDTWTLRDVDAAWLDLIEAKHPQLNRVIHAAMSNFDENFVKKESIPMAETCIISQWGSEITVYHNQYYMIFKNNPIGVYWCFSLNVEQYRYKTQPLIRYNAEIVAKRIDYSHPNASEIGEEIVIYRSRRRGLEVFGEAHTLLQSLLQAIDNGDPVWDVRELI